MFTTILMAGVFLASTIITLVIAREVSTGK